MYIRRKTYDNQKETASARHAHYRPPLAALFDYHMFSSVYDDASAQAQASEYFAGAKLRRQTAHDEAAKAYGDIIKNSSSSSEAVKAAESALKELTDALTKESDIENLIAAKVGCENLVIINERLGEGVRLRYLGLDRHLIKLAERYVGVLINIYK